MGSALVEFEVKLVAGVAERSDVRKPEGDDR